MNNKIVGIIIALVLVGLVIVLLATFMFAGNSNSYTSTSQGNYGSNYQNNYANTGSNNNGNNGNHQGENGYPYYYGESNNVVTTYNTCQNNDCFTYPVVEQKELVPCQPKPVCPLCNKQLEQTRGPGYDTEEVQVRVSC